MSAGLVLLSAVCLAAPPDGPAVGGPRLAPGEELVYHGEAVEAGTRVDNPFRKRHELEVRVVVLEAAGGTADCAVMTRVRPLPDPAVTDPGRRPGPPAVRVDLVRVDPRGRVRLLVPPAGPPPIPLGPATPTAPAPAAPPDTVPGWEFGMFVPLPAKPAAVGTTWEAADPGEPPTVWTAAREAVWNGSQCVELTAAQQTDGYASQPAGRAGWRRTATVHASPADGYASGVARRVERRDGPAVVGWVEVRYDLQPGGRHAGARYLDIRRDAEAGYWFAADLAPLLPAAARVGPDPFKAKLRKIDQYLQTQPAGTGFREGVEAVRRRCEAAARGEAPPAPIGPAPPAAAPAPPVTGRPQPARGRPAVLVFFEPGARSAADALAVAEALHRRYAGRAAVTALAVGRPAGESGLTVPVADGTGRRAAYGVDTCPRFVVVDPAGAVAWQLDGAGPKAGYLVSQQVEKLLR